MDLAGHLLLHPALERIRGSVHMDAIETLVTFLLLAK